MTPKISYTIYNLYVERKSTAKKDETYWSPIGCSEHTLESCLDWLKADFHIFKEFPNIKYKVVETIVWENSFQDVQEGIRKES